MWKKRGIIMATQQFKHWFEYFPGNFVWSQQMMSMIDRYSLSRMAEASIATATTAWWARITSRIG